MPRSARSSADAISARLRDLELLTKGPAWALTRSAPWVIAVLEASAADESGETPARSASDGHGGEAVVNVSE